MHKLDRTKLWSLERYAEERFAFRARVVQHKKARRVSLGPHATLLFEDFLTMHYQVQEMLRTERIFERSEIEAELAAYNPLIPDGSNWKATLMLEYQDAEERGRALARMAGVEDRVWAEVAGQERVFATANEDMDRSNADRTAAVHFLRFELAPGMIEGLRAGSRLEMGIDHQELPYRVEVSGQARAALTADLD